LVSNSLQKPNKDGYIHSHTHLDKTISEMVGDTMIPIIILDSTVIITQIIGVQGVDDNFNLNLKSDTIIADTFLFEFMFITEPILVLTRKFGNPFILRLKESQEIQETSNLKLRSFEIGGYTIGDSINRELISINEISKEDGVILEKAELASNEDIKFDIIGNNIIYSIERHNINNDKIDNVISVITEKLNSEPYHRKPAKVVGDYTRENYLWFTYDVDINLFRLKYEGNDPFGIYSKGDWILYYDNDILQPILSLVYGNNKPKSSIIE